ncbi:MAG: hypothetical protein MJZ86_07305 [Bacteroidales bacterium]|nr:hypothetical protein [Bacteroidales bacterium]
MKKIVRRFLQGCSLTAAMFVFQACYGTNDDYYYPEDCLIFRILDENNNAIDGITLKSLWETDQDYSVWAYHGNSDTDGIINAYVSHDEFSATKFQFSDDRNRFEVLDTTFSSLPEMDTIDIVLKKIANE